MLSPAEIASMQAASATWLPETAQISRRTLQDDGMGGFAESWAVVGSTPCSREQYGRRQDEGPLAERIVSQTRWVVTVPQSTDVTARDRILTSGRTFEVNAVLDDSFPIDVQLLCTEVV